MTFSKERLEEYTPCSTIIEEGIKSGRVKVNIETGEIILTKTNRLVKYVAPNGYVVTKVSLNSVKKTVLAHHVVWIAAYGKIPAGAVLDHINRIKTDNRICNLRITTDAGNRANTAPLKKSTSASQFKGVSKTPTKWRAQIKSNGQTIHLGAFDTEVEAALAYNAGALKYFGEHAYMNTIHTLSQPQREG